MTALSALLGIQPGITAFIGSGGKTGMLRLAGRELSGLGRVILTTSTHFYRMGDLPYIPPDAPASAFESAFEASPLLHTGSFCAQGEKLSSPADLPRLLSLCDYLLVEADGSRSLPLKSHAPTEPVIPEGCRQVILLAGAGGFHQPLKKVWHRSELLILRGFFADTPVTPALAAKELLREDLADTVFLNQCDLIAPSDLDAFARAYQRPFFYGSLQKGWWRKSGLIPSPPNRKDPL